MKYAGGKEMNILNTKYFGKIEYDQETVFKFEEGIPGFTDLHQFVVINEKDSIFTYLQSVEREDICFVMINPFVAFEDYDIEISEESIGKLGIDQIQDVMIYSILTIPENINDMTANLRAPIVLNIVNKKGLQEIISNDKYHTKHKIVKGE